MQNDNEATAHEELRTDSSWGPEQVGAYLRISPRSIKEMVGNHPTFPPPVQLGPRTFRWHPDAVVEWLRSQHDTRPPVRSTRSGRKIVERV